MKTFLAVLVFPLLLGVLSGFYSEESNNAGNKFKFRAHSPMDLSIPEILQGNNQADDKNNLQNSDWYSSAMSDIQKAEYNISYNEELGTYQSPNRKNNMRFIYHKDGFTAKLRAHKIALFDESDEMIEEKDNGNPLLRRKYKYLDEWEIQFKITNDKFQIENAELVAAGNTAFIENENIKINYTNNEDGMRQDFIIKNKPAGDGKLRLNISANTKLKMILGADALMFKDKKNDMKLKYSSLKVWDASGKELRAYFEKSNYELRITNYELKNKKNNLNPSVEDKTPNSKFLIPNSFSIVVNDEDAVYPITIDPLSSTPVWTGEINQATAYFGYSVATAGDVNGDGYSDVIVGAYLYDNGQTDEGGVFVYHGSINGLSLGPAWIKEGNQDSAIFGFRVATAGDVNGDGYSDVIIGAPAYNNGQPNEGRAYVYLGSATGLLANPFWTFENNQPDELLGYGVACAGDYNTDGFSDLIIGSYHYTNGQTKEGRIYTFKGNATSISTTPDWTFENNEANSNLGWLAATAGDVNGDGRSDIIASAVAYSNANTSTGRVYIFLSNGTNFPAAPNTVLTGTQAFEYYGHGISTAGDVNADGYSDIVIGSAFFDGGQTDEGKCFAFLGSATGLVTTPNWTKESNQVGGRFGLSVSTAGDMNGDGYADIILGGSHLANGQPFEGQAYLYLGYSGGVSLGSTIIYESNQTGAEFGTSVAIAGDVNGDGFSDIIIGANGYDNPQADEGAAFLYHGSAVGMSTIANLSYESNQTDAYFGESVSSAGDVNGDGYSDVIIGVTLFDNGHTNEGAAFVYHGSASGISAFTNWSAESNLENSNFGASVSTAGDVNGDGFSDVIIGSPNFINGQANEGKAFVYHGSASGLSALPNWSVESNQVNAFFGISVSTAGDVNGDGYSDVIVGAEDYDNGQSNEGKTFVYLGSSTGLSASAAWTAESNLDDSKFGCSVSSAGDVNGDGYSDVIIGAKTMDAFFLNSGRAFLYHGSSTGLSLTASWIEEADQSFANYGVSVSSAGDVNGDGYSDVIVGSDFYDNGQTNEGRVFVYHGSASGLSTTSNWSKESDQSGALYGASVSHAGDVNGDGYSDVIIGVERYDNGQSDEGRAYIYQGSLTGLMTTESWTSESNQAGADFGFSVSSAGDVNGDGFSDVVVGAYKYANGSLNEGAAFFFYGGNNVPGLSSNPRQFKPGSANVLSSGMQTGIWGSVKLQQFARSPFGLSNGKIVYDIKQNGTPFSGSIISNSTAFTTSSSTVSMGLTGTEINKEVTGLDGSKLYKWRSRVQYSMTAFPFQKFGSWKYYNNYIPSPHGNFKPAGIFQFNLNLTAFIEGFYNSSSNSMTGDTVTVELRRSFSPYSLLESSKKFVTIDGTSTYPFLSASFGVPYYIVLKHRNSIETWSKNTQQFTSTSLTYNFSSSAAQAFGDNQKQIDTSPVRFGIYSGDVNQDGVVDATDAGAIDNDAFNFVTGYVNTDVTGDDLVDASDAAIADNNAFNFVGKITP